MKKIYVFADRNLDKQLLEIIGALNLHVDIVDGNPHGTDHDMLDGLTEDDHSQYLLLAGRPGQRAVTPLLFGGVANNTKIEADGTIVCNGDATVWKDIDIDLSTQSIGGSAPALIAVNGDPYIKSRAFAGTGATVEQLGGSRELIHEMAFGLPIIPHIHWAPVSAAAGNVKWQLRTMLVNRNGVYTGGATTSVVVAAPGVAWHGVRTDFPAIDTTGIFPGARVMFVLFRDPADAQDTYADLVIAPNFGVHVPVDMLGTRTVDDK